MKKVVTVFVVLAFMIIALVGCSGEKPNEDSTSQNTSSENSSTATEKPQETERPFDINELKTGDEVSITGQVAGSKLINGDTLWVQVQQTDKTFVVYHCQLKDEFITVGDAFEILDVAMIKGKFLSLTDLKMENTSPTVTLYDCEIIR